MRIRKIVGKTNMCDELGNKDPKVGVGLLKSGVDGGLIGMEGIMRIAAAVSCYYT